ncbi:hypothetical protein PTKIN_Ptkin12aG0011900 [Pterospermum kingtungense]
MEFNSREDMVRGTITTWPLHAEQQLNAFELVTGLGLGVEIKMDNRRDKMKKDKVEIVKDEKIERGIKHLMEQDNDVRRRVKEMSEKSRKTLIKDGDLEKDADSEGGN